MRHIGYNLAFNTSGAFSKGSVCIHCAVYTISLTVEDLFSISTWFKSILFVRIFTNTALPLVNFPPNPSHIKKASEANSRY
mmetsp:Transcript_58683/g.65667  ORF Transcript_58683/g.65667 Transcript_58683/m.65667 type:complete len:81 (+) Transcript_58683:2070-2312(+)